MRHGKTVGVIIPALNEAAAIARVLADIPDWADRVIVVDNGSTDATAEVASANGATVVAQPERGYGAACLAGIDALPDIDIIVFVDGDHADHADRMGDLVDPIATDATDFVVGTRALGVAEKGSLTVPQRFGNALACRLMRAIWKAPFTDLGPFRAISRPALERIAMVDRNYGWTVEMQIKAMRAGLRVAEVPVPYRNRIGTSKVSGTVKGTVLAGSKILLTIARYGLSRETSGNDPSGS